MDSPISGQFLLTTNPDGIKCEEKEEQEEEQEQQDDPIIIEEDIGFVMRPV